MKLEFNQNLKKAITRTADIKKHSNYKYFNYRQLVEALNTKNQYIQDMKMNDLNLKRNYLILTNNLW